MKSVQKMHRSHCLHSVGGDNNTYSHCFSPPALLASHSAADVVVTYSPDSQREAQDVVASGCPKQI